MNDSLQVLRNDAWSAADTQALGIARDLGVGSGSRVLDVGCGGGGFLRLLKPLNPGVLIGVDVDRTALDRARHDGVDLVQARAESLPFDDDEFTHVFCMNAVTYMNQNRALRELVRVSNGYVVLAAELLLYDFYRFARVRTARQFVICVRDLAYGLISLVWQPPQSRLLGNRAFVTRRRLTRTLAALGCKIIAVRDRERLPRFMGRATQVIVVAQADGRE
jgi:SAM-dependent methyltransferase